MKCCSPLTRPFGTCDMSQWRGRNSPGECGIQNATPAFDWEHMDIYSKRTYLRNRVNRDTQQNPITHQQSLPQAMRRRWNHCGDSRENKSAVQALGAEMLAGQIRRAAQLRYNGTIVPWGRKWNQARINLSTLQFSDDIELKGLPLQTQAQLL